MRARSILTLLALCMALFSLPTGAADYRQDGHGGVFAPLCTDRKMLANIVDDFRHQAINMLHRPELGIADIIGIRQTRLIAPGTDLAPVPRRYCAATAMLTTGEHRAIWYLIEGGAGFASIGSKVEFCVAGFDRWNVYNADCRLLR
ncbi:MULTISPECIES: hypothetical protein [unclassified Roseitalea]|uniref:hypothetical protein n=1 Tax=unclassified Roseitalea TaxID=2639107 RepID=UPI00273D531B|nr:MULTISPECIES: hypothetical protein [unclassified Roseitalea]